MDDESPGEQHRARTQCKEQLCTFLHKLLPIALDVSASESPGLHALIDGFSTTNFISDASSSMLFVQKLQEDGQSDTKQVFSDLSPSGKDQGSRFHYSISEEFQSSNLAVISLALLKRCSVLSPEQPIQNQVQILNLPGRDGLEAGETAFESLHNMVKFALSPYLNSFVSVAEEPDSLSRASGDNNKGNFREVYLDAI